jgi:hypothetical protein
MKTTAKTTIILSMLSLTLLYGKTLQNINIIHLRHPFKPTVNSVRG